MLFSKFVYDVPNGRALLKTFINQFKAMKGIILPNLLSRK